MLHAYSCPHKCEACSKDGKWKIGIWQTGGCPICGAESRGAFTWSCNDCWSTITHDERIELIKLLKL
jgi:hypothetical protein